ncbi:MAG: putative 4-hydroxybenzoate polyprenyltransferase [Pirellulaceae bacterium]|nr:putative 4-hydroxybenzoate polyprenyltransferase [Pirellulaceae bacterium]
MRHLLELIRFSHTLFALPFALLAAVIAWRVPTAAGVSVPLRGRDLLGIFCCMVCARSAAMAVNRLADRDLDRANPRTQARHLPAGILSVRSVLVFTVVCAAGFLAATTLFLPNRLPLYLAIPVLVFIFGYSFAKRFTALAHFWLGAALMLAPIATWIALRGQVMLQTPWDATPAVTLGLAVLCWVAGFDMIYACQDAAHDRSARLYSIPARCGVPAALRLAAGCHLLMVLVLCGLPFGHLVGGPLVALGWIYWSSLIVLAVLLAVEHSLVRPHDLSRANVAFFHVNAIISLGLFAVVTLDLYT